MSVLLRLAIEIDLNMTKSQIKTYHASVITQHVKCISQLPSNSGKPQHGIHALGIGRYGRSLEVLDKLAHAHELARLAKRLLGRIERRDGRCWAVGAVQVPG